MPALTYSLICILQLVLCAFKSFVPHLTSFKHSMSSHIHSSFHNAISAICISATDGEAKNSSRKSEDEKNLFAVIDMGR